MSGGGRLRLLTFTTLFPNPVEPTRGLFVRNRLAGIARWADILAVAPVNAGRNPRVLATPSRRRDPAGFDVLHPRFAVLPGILKSWDAALLYRETYPQIRGALAGRSFDLVDAHYAYPDGAAAARLARLLGLPFVLTVRGSDLEVLARDGARRDAIRAALRSARAVIAVSRSLGARAVELGAEPGEVHVVPNGVDTDLFRPADRAAARASLGLPPRAPAVLAVGRLDPVKGLDLLIAAIGALRARPGGEEARAWIVGEGPMRESLEAAVRQAGLEAAVTLVGPLAPERLPAWYAAADVVCLLSHSEGCPNVVLEALACGRPVVATDVGGVPDLIQDQATGFLVRHRDPDLVADRIHAALATSWDPSALAAGARLRSWDTVAREQLAIYRRALGMTSGARGA